MSEGTGGNAYQAGYRIGGKTGSSETDEEGRTIVSFMGFAPAGHCRHYDKPRRFFDMDIDGKMNVDTDDPFDRLIRANRPLWIRSQRRPRTALRRDQLAVDGTARSLEEMETHPW